MSNENPVFLLCGKQQKMMQSFSVSSRRVDDMDSLEGVVCEYPRSTQIIIIHFGRPDSDGEEILNLLKRRGNIKIVARYNHLLNDQPANQINQLGISQDLPFFESAKADMHNYLAMAKQFDSLDPQLGAFLKNEAKKLFLWMIKNIHQKACPIMLIGLNISHRKLIDCQDLVQRICKATWPKKDILVRNIFEYLPWEESNFNTENQSIKISDLFSNESRQKICTYIQMLAPIRIYVVGENTVIDNDFVRLLASKERNITEDSWRKYIDGCIFLQYHQVADAIKNDLPRHVQADTWQIPASAIQVKSFLELFSDPSFVHAVEHSCNILAERDNLVKNMTWEDDDERVENVFNLSEQSNGVNLSKTCLPSDGV